MKRSIRYLHTNRLIIPAMVFILAGIAAACHADEARLYFTGDIIMHRPVKGSAQLHEERDPVTRESLNNGGYDFLFSRIRSRLSDGDLVLGNMEFPVMPPYTSEQFVFNCPPVVFAAMKKAGFTAVTIANNHIMDQGPDGIKNTIDELDRNNVIRIGAGRDETDARAGRIVTLRGIRVGITACTDLVNREAPSGSGGFFINRFGDPRLPDDIRKLKSSCDYCVVVIHAGDEYKAEPSPRDVRIFRSITEAGADLIIAHHPHILQKAAAVSRADGTRAVIFYSLGNFISNQSGPGTRESAVVRLSLSRKDSKDRVTPRIEILPVITSNTWDAASGRHRIQTIALADVYSEALRELGSASTPAQRQKALRKVEAAKMQAESIRKALLPGPLEGIIFLDPSENH